MSKKKTASQIDDENQSLVDHLTELRFRLIRAFIAIGIGAAVCYNFSEILFDIIRRPISPFLDATGGGLIFTGPMDKFVASIKVSLLGGLIVSCPFWVYQLWKFIAPGLYAHEKKYSLAFIFFGTVLFLSGVTFVYFVVYPLAFDFLMNYGSGTDQAMISIGEYLSFFMTTTLLFGAAFELPLILTILGMAGVIDKKFLKEKRRYAIVLMAVTSAFLTPPDVLSMSALMVPLLILYEISVVLVGIFGLKHEESPS